MYIHILPSHIHLSIAIGAQLKPCSCPIQLGLGPIPSSSFPSGYLLTGLHVDVKKEPRTLISLRPTSAAACFTQNAFKAAPVIISKRVIAENVSRARALVINSCYANARTADTLLPKSSSNPTSETTLVPSTGFIDQNLPISKSLSSTRSLGNDFHAWERAAKAFMATDTFPKLRARTFTITGVQYRMAGMDKGAEMTHPDMGPPFIGPLHATLLGCITTDSAMLSSSLQRALTCAVGRSFNSFKLTEFAIDLAKLVVRDSATEFVAVTVKGTPTYEDTHHANWGRILTATGSISLSASLHPNKVSVTFAPSDGTTPQPVLVSSEPEKVNEERASEILALEDLEIVVDLGREEGKEVAKYWTCDFSYI
ncbi:hypothetical protein GYMLUDRAFT_92363 [Collybiopsis luxurians FD-317 M1]|nr:hypothetical protein GYMLUDRAFT_92363 [Collybiopsis luxurians FD-317 M1]